MRKIEFFYCVFDFFFLFLVNKRGRLIYNVTKIIRSKKKRERKEGKEGEIRKKGRFQL